MASGEPARRQRELRQQTWPAAGITPEQVAGALHVSRAAVSSWEGGLDGADAVAPPRQRPHAYALLFRPDRPVMDALDSLRLPLGSALSAGERIRRRDLEEELLLLAPDDEH